MSILTQTKLLCKQYDIYPAKSMGQNFLINEEVYQKIIDAANLSKKDIVLEVGPGLGFLTKLLCQKAGKVIAVELDKSIFNYLQIVKELKKLDNLEIINQDILDFFDSPPVRGGSGSTFKINKPYKIVANLPYNITSIFLRKFLSAEKKPTEMILMLQKEVAERIVARPGQMSLLAISVQFYSDAEIVEYVDKTNFWPEPKVDSAIVKIQCRNRACPVLMDEKKIFRIVKMGFAAKRKKLVNNLASGLHKKPTEILPVLKKIELSANVRAQELSITNWMELVKKLETGN